MEMGRETNIDDKFGQKNHKRIQKGGFVPHWQGLLGLL
jgi:hypothetical protein